MFQIKTAVRFLQNSQVAKSPLAQSQKFLQKKGLTDQEIKIACERSGAYNNYYNQHFEKVSFVTINCYES